jgi:hypothetical protein
MENRKTLNKTARTPAQSDTAFHWWYRYERLTNSIQPYIDQLI